MAMNFENHRSEFEMHKEVYLSYLREKMNYEKEFLEEMEKCKGFGNENSFYGQNCGPRFKESQNNYIQQNNEKDIVYYNENYLDNYQNQNAANNYQQNNNCHYNTGYFQNNGYQNYDYYNQDMQQNTNFYENYQPMQNYNHYDGSNYNVGLYQNTMIPNQYVDCNQYNNGIYQQAGNNYSYDSQNLSNFAYQKPYFEDERSTGISDFLNADASQAQNNSSDEFDGPAKNKMEHNAGSKKGTKKNDYFASSNTIEMHKAQDGYFANLDLNSGECEENVYPQLIDSKSQKSHDNIKTTCGRA